LEASGKALFYQALGAKEKGQESGTSVSGEQIAYEFIRPGSSAADAQPVTLAVACAMTFRSWTATLCDPNHSCPRQKRPILSMPISINQRITAA